MGGIMDLRESSFFEFAGEEMALREARKIILLQGRERFGEPDAHVRPRLESITDIVKLEDMARRAVWATDWASLIAEPEQVTQ
jgi:hypothetical protein